MKKITFEIGTFKIGFFISDIFKRASRQRVSDALDDALKSNYCDYEGELTDFIIRAEMRNFEWKFFDKSMKRFMKPLLLKLDEKSCKEIKFSVNIYKPKNKKKEKIDKASRRWYSEQFRS